MKECVALIGLSGTGKSSVGPLLASRLGWQFVDTDVVIEQQTGEQIATIFAQQGEAAFRALETQALIAACQPQTVVATGGGIVEQPQNQTVLREQANVIWLHGQPATLAKRLDGTNDRPLLAGDLQTHLQAQAERRTPFYAALSDWIVQVDALNPDEVARQIEEGLQHLQSRDTLAVRTPGGSYQVEVRAGALQDLPTRLKALGIARRAWLISNTSILPLYGPSVEQRLRDAGIPVQSFAIPDGEAHKTLTTVSTVYDWLLGAGVERGDVILALGGGVVGDLAGFVAASVLRGIAFVQLPTTVLAMVDSSIGGKTGVDHAVGKNLIGSFHQPRLVLADTTMLGSLPAAERASGWAEAIKHGMIGDAELFYDLQRHVGQIHALQEPATSDLLRRAAAFKVEVVSGDERENGNRILLNYGHTIGHAVEAWSNFTIRHGEAVAMGMCVEAEIARRLGLIDEAVVEAQRATLQAFGLPTKLPATVEPAELVARSGSDKKVQNKQVRWVLPTGIGSMTVRFVSEATVQDAIRALMLDG